MSDEGQRVVKFNQEHYDLLVECSEKGDMTEWNKWYKKYDGDNAKKRLKNEYEGICLEKARLGGAWLEGADLQEAHLEGADLMNANLRGAKLQKAYLSGTNLKYTTLEGANLLNAHIEKASFEGAVLDNRTNLLDSQWDSETDFTATAIASAHIEPDTLTALQKNIRRKYWVKWYDQHKILQYPCRLFWWLSDYGTSSTRCIGAFALLILAACVIYFFITGAAIADIPQLFADTILATFGFGSLFDQLTGPLRLLLAAHVLAGYFLLAVLITRFAVMFQSLTP